MRQDAEKFRDGGIDVSSMRKLLRLSIPEPSVEVKDGRRFPYDVLVMATGTAAVVPNMPGVHLPGVFSLRNLEDAIHIKTWLRETNAKRVVSDWR